LAIACSSSGGTPDEELGGLVHAEATGASPLDINRAVTDIDEFSRALALPHRSVSAALGSHVFAGTSTVETREAGAIIDTLSDRTTIEFDHAGSFHAMLENSKDYGREVFFSGDWLYLRPRYGKFHRRPPTDANEPLQIRDDVFATLGAYFELMAAASDIRDQGSVDYGGRAARKVAIQLAPVARAVAAPAATQHAWRAGTLVKAVSGEVILDAESAAPLDGHFAGVVAFQRDGRTFELHLSVSHAISGIGRSHPLETPALANTVATPERLREVDERDLLLKGIAPPARKAGPAAIATPPRDRATKAP
jgi:hypothetical protein